MLKKFHSLKSCLGTALLVLASCSALTAQAQYESFISKEGEEKANQKVSEMNWADKNDLARKEQAVEQLGQRHFGQSLRNNKSDLQLLQRIANEQLIRQNDVEKLQALGAVLGNVLRDELGLEWKVYEDARGRSRALCVSNTEHCLFPLTMLSRRLEVGLKVDVDRIYADALAAIDPYLPDTNAYDGKKPDPEDRPSWIDDRKTRPPMRIRIQ